MKKQQHSQKPTSLSELGGDTNLTPQQRAKAHLHKAVKPQLPTHAYTGKTASERAADRKKANS